MTTNADDEKTVAAMALEVQRKVTAPMEIIFHPMTLFQLTGLVQLALRHQDVSPELRATAERFLISVRQYFADAPTVLDVIRRGDDPAQDIVKGSIWP